MCSARRAGTSSRRSRTAASIAGVTSRSERTSGLDRRDRGDGRLALRAPLVVRGRLELARGPRVAGDERHVRQRQRDRPVLEGPAVQQQRPVRLAEDRRELVHDPVVEPDVAVLRALDDVDEVHRIHGRPVPARQRPARTPPRSPPRTTARRPAAGRTPGARGTRAAPRPSRPAPTPSRRRSRAMTRASGPTSSTSKTPVSPVAASVSSARPSSVGTRAIEIPRSMATGRTKPSL